MSTPSVASIGECMLELSGQQDDLWNLGFAGDTFNTLWALRALLPQSGTTDFVTAFGDDPFSEKQIAFLTQAGIGTAASPRLKGLNPGLYAITLRGAERSFTYWRNDAAARRLADDPEVLARSLEKRDLVYFSGITLAILAPEARIRLFDAVEAARKAGAKVAFDPNYRVRLWQDQATAKEAMSRALATADIALPTFPDEEALFGDATPGDTIKRLRDAGVAEIVVKNGEEAAHCHDGGALEIIEGVAVPNPVDTTGAGDSFNGSYLAARLAGTPPAEAVGIAHRVAAEVVQVRGALAPYERLRSAYNAAG